MNIFRRLPLSRLLLLCGAALAVAISATALASALTSAPVPPAKPLAVAVHDALSAPAVEGVSANVTLTDHLLEGANLASGGQDGQGASGSVTENPLLTGASGRLWVASDGRLRLELESEKGDTEVVSDGHLLTIYDSSSNTVYRVRAEHEDSSGQQPGGWSGAQGAKTPPSLAEIESDITKLSAHAALSGATPTDVAGQPAYTVRVAPQEKGSLIGGAELSFDAVHGLPLRAALYSSTAAAPVIELAATSVSYGPVSGSVFEVTPPADAKVQELVLGEHAGSPGHAGEDGERPKLSVHGDGPTAIAVLEAKAKGSGDQSGGGSNSCHRSKSAARPPPSCAPRWVRS